MTTGWSGQLGGQRGLHYCQDIWLDSKTTNDLAERAIKTATDYSQILTKDESTRRRIIQGVEDCRRTYPDFKKSTLNK